MQVETKVFYFLTAILSSKDSVRGVFVTNRG